MGWPWPEWAQIPLKEGGNRLWLSGGRLTTWVILRPDWIFPGDICLTRGSVIRAATSAKPGPECLHHQPVCFPVLSKVSFPDCFFGSFLCTGRVYQVLAPPAVREKLCKDFCKSHVFQESGPRLRGHFSHLLYLTLTVHVSGSLQDPQSQHGSLYAAVGALRESVSEARKCGLAHNAFQLLRTWVVVGIVVRPPPIALGLLRPARVLLIMVGAGSTLGSLTLWGCLRRGIRDWSRRLRAGKRKGFISLLAATGYIQAAGL